MLRMKGREVCYLRGVLSEGCVTLGVYYLRECVIRGKCYLRSVLSEGCVI